MNRPLPVLWVCGASGAGKSAAAWALVAGLAAAGERVAYVDIDQLGMLHPAPRDDPAWHHELKVEALRRLVPGYAAAGARLLVVSGVVDVSRRPNLSPESDLALWVLSPGPTTLRQRILTRGWDDAAAADAVAEDAALRAMSWPDGRIDSASMTIEQTAARLRAAVVLAPASPASPAGTTVSTASTDVVVVTGPRAAGSSTVGFGLAVSRWRAGRPTAFLDLQQLGFVTEDGVIASEPALGVRHLATMHDVLAARGAELVVVTARLSAADRTELRAALPRAQVTIVRLRADEHTLAEHVRERVEGSAARLAGDDLLGADLHHQHTVVAAALAEQHVLESSVRDDAVLTVDGRSIDEVIVDLQHFT